MKRIALVLLFLLPSAFAQQQWSIGYYTPYGSPGSPVSALDMGGLTHIVHWGGLVQANGTLDLNYQQITADAPSLISKAHGAGVKVIFGIVNPYWLGQSGNLPSAAANYRAALVSNVMNVVNTYGYDGVDIDWEPLNVSTDGANFKALAADLKAQLGSKPLMTATVVTDYAFWGSAHGSFDRINMMTYDMCGTWDSYSWYNSALYDQDGMVWSVNLAATRYKNAGVPAYKLGIGIPFYGYQWSGVSGPRQPMSGASLSQSNYQSLVSMVGAPQWDSLAMVPYTTGSSSWTSFENAQSITEKVNYVKANGLGGWIIWNLSSDYIPTANPAHPLLTAIKNAMGPALTTPLSITSSSPLPAGLVGTAYSQSLAAAGAAPISWSITSGALPAGLNLGSNGVISGIPTAAGANSFTVKATDASGASASQALSITVYAPLRITPTSLSGGAVGAAYSVTLAASGGKTPYVSAALTGNLPAGLSLNLATGLLSGTPTTAGTSNFSVSLTDSNGVTVTQPLSITVYAPLRITPASLSGGAVGAAYSVTLAGSGGKTPYVSASMTGTLPAGLSLNLATGLLSGTPTTAGTSNFSVSLTDSSGVTVTQPLSITVYAPLRIAPTSLPAGTVGSAYSVTLAASGGKTPYVSAALTGNLPAGLSLNLATGLLSGTPTTAGTSNFSVSLTDSSGVTASQVLSITIH